MRNKGVEFEIITQKGSVGKILDPLEYPTTSAMAIRWKYKGKEWATLVDTTGELDENTVKTIEFALNNIGGGFTYRGERHVLDKVVQKIHRVGVVFRHKLQSRFSASPSDGKLETEEVERD